MAWVAAESLGSADRLIARPHPVATLQFKALGRADARLVLIGAEAEPEEAAALKSLASGPALAGRVLLAGYRPNARRFAAAFDVCAIPSLRKEGLPIAALDAMNIGVVSTRETWLNTTSPLRGLLIAIFSWVAEQERARLIERTKAGIRRAKEQGIEIGRPRRVIDMERARMLMAAGATQAEAAKLCGVSPSILCRALKRAA